jgi:hypothetical protein
VLRVAQPSNRGAAEGRERFPGCTALVMADSCRLASYSRPTGKNAPRAMELVRQGLNVPPEELYSKVRPRELFELARAALLQALRHKHWTSTCRCSQACGRKRMPISSTARPVMRWTDSGWPRGELAAAAASPPGSGAISATRTAVSTVRITDTTVARQGPEWLSGDRHRCPSLGGQCRPYLATYTSLSTMDDASAWSPTAPCGGSGVHPGIETSGCTPAALLRTGCWCGDGAVRARRTGVRRRRG